MTQSREITSLDIEPTHLHQRTALFVGDRAEVEGTVTRINEGG